MPSGQPINYYLRSVDRREQEKKIPTEQPAEEILNKEKEEEVTPIMAALLAEIPKFSGEGNMSAENWWEKYTRWCVFNGINAGRAANGVALYFTGPASHWYESLKDGVKNDLDQLEAAFKAYERKQNNAMRCEADDRRNPALSCLTRIIMCHL